MSGKPAATKYVECRNVAQNLMGGRARIKHELVPGIAAWLVMLSRRYALAAEAVRRREVFNTVPGSEKYKERMEWACEHLAMLANSLRDGFSKSDYADSARVVAQVLELPENLIPSWDLDEDMVSELMPEEVFRGDQGTGGVPLQPCVAPCPGRGDGVGGGLEARPERAGEGGLGHSEARPAVHVPSGARGGGSGSKGDRQRGSSKKRPAKQAGRAKR